ncbi:hypothetical protein M1R55_23490 (plasmid) [Deinococcus sp. QL22]|nr:hypothetical protein [Deinococcus sp. QL22]UQN09026.1 hypothetical protein M1R55_23490 [Deinococcus sp. QL22]
MVAEINAAVPGGVDFSSDCVGRPAILRQAFEGLKVMDTCGLLGVPPYGTEVSVPMQALLSGRRMVGIIEGTATLRPSFPR